MSKTNDVDGDTKEGIFINYRLVDANLNRLKEGIRVVEDIYRYIYNDEDMSKALKLLRHTYKLDNKQYKNHLINRDIINDPLTKSITDEQKRDNIISLIIANYKRAQESSRVLEEIFKLQDINKSEIFKNIRYKLYLLEKEVLKKLPD
jgi:thiamine-phosphate pyrophosphorylase